jgi:hypothetical protein
MQKLLRERREKFALNKPCAGKRIVHNQNVAVRVKLVLRRDRHG